MANKRLLVYLTNNIIKFEDDEEKVRHIFNTYHTARIAQTNSGFICGPNFLINMAFVQAMLIVDAKQTPQEKYMDRINRQLDEGESWRYGKDEDDEEGST